MLFVAPLLVFVPTLMACRVHGVSQYRELAELGSSVERVEAMRLAPISLRLVTLLLAAALLPMPPLALFNFPLMALLSRFLTRLTGM